MTHLKLIALALALGTVAGCATFDRVTVADNSMSAPRAYVPARAMADPTQGAGGSGGSGAGVVR
jgi:hypothetical protein